MRINMEKCFSNSISGWTLCITIGKIIFCVINQCQSGTMFRNQSISTDKKMSPPPLPSAILCRKEEGFSQYYFTCVSLSHHFFQPICHRVCHSWWKNLVSPPKCFPKMTSWFHGIRFFGCIKFVSKLFVQINHVWTNQFFIQLTDDFAQSICSTNDVKINILKTQKRATILLKLSSAPNHWNTIHQPPNMWWFLVEFFFWHYLHWDLPKYHENQQLFHFIVPLLLCGALLLPWVSVIVEKTAFAFILSSENVYISGENLIALNAFVQNRNGEDYCFNAKAFLIAQFFSKYFSLSHYSILFTQTIFFFEISRGFDKKTSAT